MQWFLDFRAEWTQPGYGAGVMAAMCVVARNLMFLAAVGFTVAWAFGVGDLGLRDVAVLWLLPVGFHLTARLLVVFAHREIDAAEGR